MTSIALSAWGHSGIRLEHDGQRLVLDPGMFTDPAILEDAAAILISHEHPDHVVPDILAPRVAAGRVPVWAPAPVVDALAAAGAPGDLVHVVQAGDAFTAAGLEVQVLGGEHAVIHPSLPVVANAAYLVAGAVLHPGDSFTPAPEGARVQVLALPVSAPWLKVAEAMDYLAAVGPDVAVPIHDAILSDGGRAFVDRLAEQLSGTAAYRRLAPGETFVVDV